MGEARGTEDWCHTSALLAQQANLHRPKEAKPVKPAQLNPYLVRKRKRRPGGPVPKVGIEILKALL